MNSQKQSHVPLSLWHDSASGNWAPQVHLEGDVSVDVAIIGAGYTGLWTAYYLAKADRHLRIAVIDSKFVGFGASGRNGGWCSAIFPASLRKVASSSSREAAVRMQLAMNETVQEIENVVANEAIDCDLRASGYVSVARNAGQWARAQREVATWRSWGFGEEHMALLNADEASERVAASRVLGGTFTPHCSAVQPAKLVQGLAETVRALGVEIFEDTTVVEIDQHGLRTDRGRVSSEVVVRATEGYTAQMPGAKRDLVPMYSLMIATEQLPEDTWRQIGLRKHETFADKRHLRIYGQRTVDNRIAFGGRGAPYHFGSKVKPEYDVDGRVHAMLRSILVDLFPVVASAEITHAWGGNLGIPRDWYPSVTFDRTSGFAQAGGYVGDGVATSNLAGRTLAAEILDLDSDLRSLPWVNRHSPSWEAEPFRWLGVNAGTLAFNVADRSEQLFGKPSRLASTFWNVLGH